MTPNIILSVAINYVYKDNGWGVIFNVIGHDPSVSKSSRLHGMIIRSFTLLRGCLHHGP